MDIGKAHPFQRYIAFFFAKWLRVIAIMQSRCIDTFKTQLDRSISGNLLKNAVSIVEPYQQCRIICAESQRVAVGLLAQRDQMTL